MAGKSEYEMKQVEAYRIAEADGFRQHPDVYWHQAETAPSTSKPRKKAVKKKKPTSKKPPQKKPLQKKPAAKKTVKDKLTVVEGIGPKIAGLLNADGIHTFADLAKTKVGTLRNILQAAGPRYAFHKPNSWPKQARLARDGKMDALKKLQDELDGGR